MLGKVRRIKEFNAQKI